MIKKTILIWLFLVGCVYAEPNNRRDFLAEGYKSNKVVIQLLTKLDNSTRNKETSKYLKSIIRDLRTKDAVAAPTLQGTYRIGDVGLMGKATIFQVIDKNTVILKYDYTQISLHKYTLFWVEDIDTSKMTNGDYWVFAHLFKIDGTKTYNTQMGSNTIYTAKILKGDNFITMGNKKIKIITLDNIIKHLKEIGNSK